MNNLKKFRMKMGMTQADLSKATGIKIRTIGSWEDGSVAIEKAAFISIMKVAKVLEIDPIDLIGGDIDG